MQNFKKSSYKETPIKKTIAQFKKWAGDQNRHFPKEDIQISNEHLKGAQLH